MSGCGVGDTGVAGWCRRVDGRLWFGEYRGAEGVVGAEWVVVGWGIRRGCGEGVECEAEVSLVVVRTGLGMDGR